MKTVTLILIMRFRSFRMEEVRAYMDLVKEITDKIPKSILGNARDDFDVAYKEYIEVLKQVAGSAYTQKLVEKDNYRDKITVGFTTTVEANTHHFDPVIAEASRQLKIILKSAKGLISMPQSQQTASTKDLVENLKSPRFNHLLDEAGVRNWVNEMEAANLDFETTFLERGEDQGEYHIETGSSLEIRKKVIAEYVDFIETLNAIMRVLGAGTEAIDAAALSLNEITRQYKNTIAQRQGISAAKKDKEDENPETGTSEDLGSGE